MINNNSITSFLFLILGGRLLLLLPILHINVDGTSIINNYVRQYCAGVSSNSNSNSNALLSSLASKAAAASPEDKDWPANFYQTDFNGSGTIYGLYLCRKSDLSSVCSDCIASAKVSILNLCPMAEEAIVWKENCMLRYSNHSLFSKLDDTLYSPHNQTLHDPKLIADVDMLDLLNRTLDNVTAQAVMTPGTKNFATKEGYYKSNTTPALYSLAACTPDLSPYNCSKCLNRSREHLPVQYEGGIVLLPSCILRFGLRPFYQSTSTQLPPDINSPPPPWSPPPPPQPPPPPRKKILIIVALSTLLPAGLCVFFYLRWTSTRRTNNLHAVETDDNGIHIARTRHGGTDHDDFSTIDALQFNFGTLQYATGNFFTYSKIGEGGFGNVYKGILPDGREVAVKRLSRKLEHGEEEFKNEALIVAKLQHKNLVRLLGFCLHNDEKLLVFEFVPNHSLDYFLFGDSTKQKLLNWPARFNIVRGIARGLLYLHEESRQRIIHRDIKASNILLDEKMEPKIADFGMARMFGTDQTEDQTGRVAGTHGYIAPEYMVQGQYSVKSDVYSFGVLILEIISGKKNRSFHQTGLAQDLVIYAWKLWLKGTPCELMDSTVTDSQYDEVKRCIQVGLFCVEKVADKRPSMARVVHMLNMSSFDKFPSLDIPDFLSLGRVNIDNQYGQTMSPQRRGPYQLIDTSVPSSSGNNASITELLPR